MKKNGTSFAFDSFKSDFNGITKNKNDLYLTNLFHQSTVEIDEEGGENALTTIYVAMRRSAFVFDVPNVLKCNKPFLFFVHDRQTEEILYFGKIVNPNSI
jgi:serine protease inhibitor